MLPYNTILCAKPDNECAYYRDGDGSETCGVLTVFPTELNKTTGKGDSYLFSCCLLCHFYTPTLHHFPLFCSHPVSSSLPSHYTHSLSLSLSVWTMPLWQEPRIADDVTQELCGSADCSHSRKACWDKQSLRGKKWQSSTSWCNYSSIILRNYCEWQGRGPIIE